MLNNYKWALFLQSAKLTKNKGSRHEISKFQQEILKSQGEVKGDVNCDVNRK